MKYVTFKGYSMRIMSIKVDMLLFKGDLYRRDLYRVDLI